MKATKNRSNVAKDTELVLMRPPLEKDSEIFTRYINELSSEKTYIAVQGEQTTEKETEEYIKRIRKNVHAKKEIYLLLFLRDELVGAGGITLLQKIYSTTGNMSITIKKDFRGKGLGARLSKKLLEEVSRLRGVQKIVLQVFGNNAPAIRLYKKLGFKEYGRLPKAITWRNKLIDEILMYKNIAR